MTLPFVSHGISPISCWGHNKRRAAGDVFSAKFQGLLKRITWSYLFVSVSWKILKHDERSGIFQMCPALAIIVAGSHSKRRQRGGALGPQRVCGTNPAAGGPGVAIRWPVRYIENVENHEIQERWWKFSLRRLSLLEAIYKQCLKCNCVTRIGLFGLGPDAKTS